MKTLYVILILLAGCMSTYSQKMSTLMSENPVWKRSQIVPVPSFVEGVADFCFDASEGWLMMNEPKGDVVTLLSMESGWEPMTKQLTNTGARVPNYQTRLFKRLFAFPESFQNRRIIIRFEGVAHAAKLYVNGQFVRDHWGSFSAWTADITDFVRDGKAVVGIYTDERKTGLAAYTNGCAFEPLYISGIQYGVSCYAVPQDYIVRANQDVYFDSEYKNARLRISMHVAQNSKSKEKKLTVEVKSPEGKPVKVVPSTFSVPESTADFCIESTVSQPVKWDAEHPELCTMVVSLYSDGEKVESVSRKIGFRQVELKGRNLYVNGQEVKCRGIWGGNDAKQLRDMNINHVRKNWATQGFLDSCDLFGVYVLDEIPATFVRGEVPNNPEDAQRWLEMMADMVERDYAHPSVIMWSHGNESSMGTTMQKLHKFIKAEDPQRPDMYSWAQDVPTDEELPYDIYSFHYPDVMLGPRILAECQTSVFNSESQIVKRFPKPEMPVLADEFAHIPFSGAAAIDPNIRNFWGESIKLFWDYMYNTDGSLGGNQFGVFTGLGARVQAPEEWHLRKAYSPVCVEDDYLSKSDNGQLSFRVQNRFCHTNLNEIELHWKTATDSGSLMCPAIAPSQYGRVILPVKHAKQGDLVEMAFERRDGFQVDEYALTIGAVPFVMPQFSDKAPSLNENDELYTIGGNGFTLAISKKTGQIVSGIYKEKLLITGGPQLAVGGAKEALPEWQCKSVSAAINGNRAEVKLEGNYANCKVTFTLQIDNEGIIATRYAVRDFGFEPQPAHELPWNNQHFGGFSEIGVKFELTADIDRLSWDRKALWSVYPENHIGAPTGTAYKSMPENPNDWGTFTTDKGTFMVFGSRAHPYTNNFRGMKEYIRTATVFAGNSRWGLQVFSPMTDAVRLQPSARGTDNVEIWIDNRWNYPTLGNGNFRKRPIFPFEKQWDGIVRMRFISE